MATAHINNPIYVSSISRVFGANHLGLGLLRVFLVQKGAAKIRRRVSDFANLAVRGEIAPFFQNPS